MEDVRCKTLSLPFYTYRHASTSCLCECECVEWEKIRIKVLSVQQRQKQLSKKMLSLVSPRGKMQPLSSSSSSLVQSFWGGQQKSPFMIGNSDISLKRGHQSFLLPLFTQGWERGKWRMGAGTRGESGMGEKGRRKIQISPRDRDHISYA